MNKLAVLFGISIVLSQVAAATPNNEIPTELNNPVGLQALQSVDGPNKDGRGPLHKIGLELALAYHENLDYQAKGGFVKLKKPFKPSDRLMRIVNDQVLVNITASGDVKKVTNDLRQLGMENVSVFGKIISGYIPVAKLDKVAALTDIQRAYPSYAITQTGLVNSQGDSAMYSNTARTTYKSDGTGIIIGTLSDSYNCKGGAATDVSSNDLPANITVLQEEIGCVSGTDEGRAMMQIIHDIAPGSQQKFYSAFNGVADFANGIIALADAGAKVINDDVMYIYPAEPMFQDGVIAQAVNQVRAREVAYFSAAGNNYNRSYESAYRDSGLKGNKPTYHRHDFDPGTGVDGLMTVTIPANTSVHILLQWDDPSYSATNSIGADTDMDLFVYNMSGGLVKASTNNNIGNDPAEFISSLSNTTAASVSYQVAIDHRNGPVPNKLKFIYFGSMTINEYATNSPTLYGHANAAGAMAVGAARYNQTPAYYVSPPIIESYSSLGGVPILFNQNGSSTNETRQKPDFVAPDGVDTTFFGSDTDGNGRPNFYGTSAAAPHAAALAGLMWSFEPTTTVDNMYLNMRASTIDMGTANFDYKTGFGLAHSGLALGKYDQDQDAIVNRIDNCIDVSNFTQANFDADTQGDACDLDDDNDGLLDTAEVVANTNPLDSDSDNDGLLDGEEVNVYRTNPNSSDSDLDGVTDRDEIQTYHLNPLVSNKGYLAPRGSPDNVLNVADMLIQQRIILNHVTPTTLETALADMNNDGQLNVADMLLLQRQILNQTP